MTRFDFVTLRVFVAIADEGQLTAAAEREHLALAAVSKRISDLEVRLGTPLFYRRARGVELTPAGRVFLHHARRILSALAGMQAELSEYGEGVRGHVRLHSNTSAIIAFLPHHLSSFSRRYPEIKLELEERTSTEIVSAVRDGIADVGIFAAHVDPGGLEILSYQSDQLVLVTPLQHRLADRTEVLFSDALDDDFVGLQQDTSLHALLHEQAGRSGKTLRVRIQVRSFDAICRMIHHDMGVGVLPRGTLYNKIDDLELRQIPLLDPWARRDLVIGVWRYHMLPVVARHLVDHLLDQPCTRFVDPVGLGG